MSELGSYERMTTAEKREFLRRPIGAKPLVTGLLVRCLNCKMLWRSVDGYSPGRTVVPSAIQVRCPGCHSNAWEREKPPVAAKEESLTNQEERI